MKSFPEDLTRIVCFGDSITEGFDLPITHHWSKVMHDELAVRGGRIEEVYVRGVGGNTAAMGMDRINADLKPILPALVLLEFGINDAYVNPWTSGPRASVEQFTAQLSAMIGYIRGKGGLPVLFNNHPLSAKAGCHPQGNGRSIVENMMPYRASVRRLADAEKVPLIDLERSLGADFLEALHPDGIHLAPKSSVFYGQAVGAELVKWISSIEARGSQ